MTGVKRVALSALASVAAAVAVSKGKQYLDRRRALPNVPPELRHSRLFFPISASNRFNNRLIALLLNRPSLLPEGVANLKYEVSPDTPISDSAIRERWHEIFSDYESLQAGVPISEYVPVESSEQNKGSLPALIAPKGVILWFHGGGLIAGSYDEGDEYCGKLAQDTQCTLLSVQYRLAPDYPFPYPLLDCATALLHAHQKAQDLGVPLVIAGMSAGGGLAAATAQVAADLGIPVAFQALIYPMLDSETGRVKLPGKGDFLWTPSANRYGWKSYLKDIELIYDSHIRTYCVPARREDFASLAPAWIGCGDLDLFYDESVKYHEQLEDAGVESIFYDVPGMYHAADGLAPEAESMKRFYASMVNAICDHLSK